MISSPCHSQNVIVGFSRVADQLLRTRSHTRTRSCSEQTNTQTKEQTNTQTKAYDVVRMYVIMNDVENSGAPKVQKYWGCVHSPLFNQNPEQNLAIYPPRKLNISHMMVAANFDQSATSRPRRPPLTHKIRVNLNPSSQHNRSHHHYPISKLESPCARDRNQKLRTQPSQWSRPLPQSWLWLQRTRQQNEIPTMIGCFS